MQLVNLTPDEVSFVYDEGEIWIMTLPPSGVVASVDISKEMIGEAAGRPVYRVTFGEVTGLPEPKEGLCYLVSREVAEAVKRPDVVTVDIGPTALRNGKHVLAVCELVTFA
jgi:hypothetical protein